MAIDLEPLVKRLLVYTTRQIRRYTWRSQSAGFDPPDVSACDFVHEAFRRYLSGTRRLPKGKSELEFFAGTIHSLISHHFARRENQAIHLSIAHGEEALPGTINAAEIPDVTRASAEDELQAQELLRALQREFAGEHVLLRYIELRASEQFETAEEYAQALREPSRDSIYTMNRRLERWLRRQRR